ncbi:post-GPI attachment to proteins factor 3 [Hyalella azteca]|uniref:Post-GPI attachment to proteins factor 3 n=1 Tax=Hyalella azteca TaxID=294128 RepID=A0A8B7NAV3_HYAAZ|nr:post-GPI attachment to proteins factor 3 [Hyalella azteca]
MYLVLIAVWVCGLGSASASVGDRSNEFRGCLYVCRFNNCSQEFAADPYRGGVSSVESSSEDWSALLHRTCTDECRYHCMWVTTRLFLEDDRDTPQFYGKWPFIRILGLDEPASVLFSLMNLLGHCHGLWRLHCSLPSHAPMFSTWRNYALVSINAWFWSAVFHARDLVFTERLDYFSALSMVLYSLYALCIRAVGRGRDHIKQSVGAACVALYAYHIWYLTHKHFDYSYNMKVNVTIGDVHLLLLDAHALWHLCTVPLPLYWYRFVIADCQYILDKTEAYRETPYHRLHQRSFKPFVGE